MNVFADNNEKKLKGSIGLLSQLKDQVSGHQPEARELIQ